MSFTNAFPSIIISDTGNSHIYSKNDSISIRLFTRDTLGGNLLKVVVQIWMPGSWNCVGPDSTPTVLDSSQIVKDTISLNHLVAFSDTFGLRLKSDGKYLIRGIVTAGDSVNVKADLIIPVIKGISGIQLTNADLSGWTLASGPDSLETYDSTDLTNAFDGGAFFYTQNGLLLAIEQHLLGPNGAALGPNAYIMEFEGDSGSTATYNHELLNVQSSGIIALSAFDTSIAFASTFGTNGYIVYAHFQNYFLQLPFSGFTDQTTALTVASKFLVIIRQKIMAP